MRSAEDRLREAFADARYEGFRVAKTGIDTALDNFNRVAYQAATAIIAQDRIAGRNSNPIEKLDYDEKNKPTTFGRTIDRVTATWSR